MLIKRILVPLCLLLLLTGVSVADDAVSVVSAPPVYLSSENIAGSPHAPDASRVVFVCSDIESLKKCVPSLSVESAFGELVQASVATEEYETLAAAGVQIMRAPLLPVHCALSEGVYLSGATDWQLAGYSGTGQRIAIIDTGYEGYDLLLGADLPVSVELLSFRADGSHTNGGPHGTAMAELIHDMAPGADLVLVSAGTEVEFLSALQGLAVQDVDIVASGLGWILTGPGDGTGLISDAVDAAIQSSDWLWVQAAGNQAQRHWSGTWQDADANGWLDWTSQGAAYNIVELQNGETLRLGLQWDDAWGGASADFELVLTDAQGELVAWSDSPAVSPGDPTRYLEVDGLSAGEYRVYVFRRDGGHDVPVLQLYGYEHDLHLTVALGSLLAPADVPDALSVGAVSVEADGQVELYSSRGPTTDGRLKPDMVSYDRVSTESLGPRSAGTGFSGTSAASAHVAGAAALLWEAHPAWTMQQMRLRLEALCIDIDAPGPDYVSGHGRLELPDEADPTPTAAPSPTASFTVEPSPTVAPLATPTMTPVPALLETAWTRIGLTDVNVRALIQGDETGTLWVGTDSGILYSPDGGVTWLPRMTGLADASVYTLYDQSLSGGQVLYATTSDMIWRWDDSYWQQIPVRSTPVRLITTFGLGRDAQLYAVIADACGAFYTSLDSGACWSQYLTQDLCGTSCAAGRILADSSGQLYLSRGPDRAVLLSSKNGGISWQELARPAAGIVDMSLSSGGQLFASLNGSGVWQYDAAQDVWSLRSAGLAGDGQGTRVSAIVTHPFQTDTLFTAIADGRIYKSTTAGENWELFGSAFPPDLTVNALYVLPSWPTRLWAATDSGLWALDRAVDIGLPLILKNRYMPPGVLVPTATPVGCYDTIANGGFESSGIWELDGAVLTSQDVHEGLRSVSIGPQPPVVDEGGLSCVSQTVLLPEDVASIELRYWWQRYGEVSEDAFFVRLYDADDQLLGEPLKVWGPAPYWEQQSVDLTAWQGQQVRLCFAVQNDGVGEASWFRLDDVALQVCPD